ncbi:MAG TPA: HNH endonuclease signature motif containing protein [Flavisolibacter sp.]|nr:HNH endonuclease signature motif containing protein [Flavisolibacter sp.]
MCFVPIKKVPNYFIHKSGYVIKIVNGKEQRVIPFKTKKSQKVFVKINDAPRELVYLMMEYFDIKFTPYDRISYKVTDNLEIPFESIKVKQFASKHDLPEQDERLLYKYKCDFKANASNFRSKEIVTPLQVFLTLKINNYSCVYCQEKLIPENWHLDHFTPLSKGGKNIFENIVPSCAKCNIMKGALDGYQFYAHCRKIANLCIYNGKDLLSNYNPSFENQ